MEVRYRYKDSEFLMREIRREYERPYYEVVGMLSYGYEVNVPSTVNGYEVKGLRFSSGDGLNDSDKIKYSYHGVTRLLIPSEMKIYSLYNINFPDLEEILFFKKNGVYVFSDGLLYSNRGKKLLLTFKKGMQSDEIRIPSKVEDIASGAFRDTGVRRIIFTNPNIRLEGNPFENSVWLNEHKEFGGTLFVGNMAFRHFSADELILDSSIKRISPDCFNDCCPEAFTTHFIPNGEIISKLNEGGCRKLTITSDCAIPWDLLRTWFGLSEVRLTAHGTYIDRDGVVFNQKRNELVFYPPNRTSTSYKVPDGTTLIGCKAFMNQGLLKEITLCDSISEIMPGAFYNCANLKRIFMDDCMVSELPDAGIFNDYGVFEGCRNLTEIKFPKALRRIGKCAFYKAGLKDHMVINEGIKSIGAYAFSETNLSQIDLPKTLEYIEPGAFVNRASPQSISISLYENMTSGLFEALEYVKCGSDYKDHLVMWQGADVTFWDQEGDVADTIHIPKSIADEYKGLLELAITHRGLDREIYLRCLEGFEDKEERISVALEIIGGNKDVDGICDAHIRQMAAEIADRYISDSLEKKLIEFLKMGYLTSEDMRTALKKCNDKGMSQAAAYLLRFLSIDQSNKGTTISL